MNIHFEHFTTASGEKKISLSEAEFELLEDILDAVRIDEVQSQVALGQSNPLTHAEMLELIDAPTPLAFWRKKRAITQEKLAKIVGVSQSYIADLSNGKKVGDPALFLRLARALDVRMESLVVG